MPEMPSIHLWLSALRKWTRLFFTSTGHAAHALDAVHAQEHARALAQRPQRVQVRAVAGGELHGAHAPPAACAG